MTTAASLIRTAQNQIARHFASTTIKITAPGVSAFNSDLSVTMSPSSCTVDCSHPRAYTADDASGDRSLRGSAFVLVNRADSNLTIEPQPGMVAEVAGEQYRVEKAEYPPGAVRIFLRGGAAEGTASA